MQRKGVSPLCAFELPFESIPPMPFPRPAPQGTLEGPTLPHAAAPVQHQPEARCAALHLAAGPLRRGRLGRARPGWWRHKAVCISYPPPWVSHLQLLARRPPPAPPPPRRRWRPSSPHTPPPAASPPASPAAPPGGPARAPAAARRQRRPAAGFPPAPGENGGPGAANCCCARRLSGLPSARAGSRPVRRRAWPRAALAQKRDPSSFFRGALPRAPGPAGPGAVGALLCVR